MEKHHWSEARKVEGNPDTNYEGANAPKHPRELMNGDYVPVDEIPEEVSNNPEDLYIAAEEAKERPEY